jgi:biotin carboxylase
MNVICLATYFKGGDFIRECKQRGCNVVLITREKMLKENWPRESLDDLIAVPNDAGPPLMIDLVAHISRKMKPDRVVALEEFDVVTAALIREHFQLPGMNASVAKGFRDKLAMARSAHDAGVDVPDFVPLINADDILSFIERVPSPWLIKPRSDVSAIGIRKVESADEVLGAFHEMNKRENLRERGSYYLLARFVPGEVFHVDSVVNNGRVSFAGTNRYGRPPMQVAHQGGAYVSRTVARGSENEKKLLEANRKLVKALGMKKGATHAEFIKSETDGKFYFLEIAARVGGAYIAEVLEAASGLNLWREWARIELADDESAQKPAETKNVEKATVTGKRTRKEYAGIVLCLAKQEHPDTSAYDDPEIVCRVKKRHHAGLIVRSKKLERVEDLLDKYTQRFADDFVAVVPPLEKAE